MAVGVWVRRDSASVQTCSPRIYGARLQSLDSAAHRSVREKAFRGEYLQAGTVSGT